MRNLLKLLAGFLGVVGFILFVVSFFAPYTKDSTTYDSYFYIIGGTSYPLFIVIGVGLCLSFFFLRREMRLLGYTFVFFSSIYYLGSSATIYNYVQNQQKTTMFESVSTLLVAGCVLLVYSLLGIVIEQLFKKEAN